MADQRTYDDPSDILDAIFRQELAGVHVCKVARVERYDAATGRCDAQPLYKRIVSDDLGERTEADPLIPNVPVMFPGSDELSITWPLKKGAFVLLVFTDHSLDRMAEKGGVIDPIATRDPGATRTHHISDAIAIPMAGKRALGAVTAPTIEIKTTGAVHIGGNQPLVTKADFDAHTHPAPGGATSAPTAPATGTAKLRG